MSTVSSLALAILLRGHLAAIFAEMPGRFWAICGELGTNGALPDKKQLLRALSFVLICDLPVFLASPSQTK